MIKSQLFEKAKISKPNLPADIFLFSPDIPTPWALSSAAKGCSFVAVLWGVQRLLHGQVHQEDWQPGLISGQLSVCHLPPEALRRLGAALQWGTVSVKGAGHSGQCVFPGGHTHLLPRQDCEDRLPPAPGNPALYMSVDSAPPIPANPARMAQRTGRPHSPGWISVSQRHSSCLSSASPLIEHQRVTRAIRVHFVMHKIKDVINRKCFGRSQRSI